jgi:hypothetical protein
VGDDQFAERTAALGVDDALWNALAVEVGELLDQVVVVEQDGALRARGEGFVVADDGNSEVVGGGALCFRHGKASRLHRVRV